MIWKGRMGVAAAAVLLVAACTGGEPGEVSASRSDPPAASSSADRTRTSSASPSRAATSPSPSPTATLEDPKKARAEITKTWQTFFNPHTSVSETTKLLEDGVLYELFVQAIANDRQLGTASATVDKVSLTSPTQADVVFRLSRRQKPVLQGVGQAVRQDKRWKVSVKTLCAIAETDDQIARPGVCERPNIQ